MSVGHAHTLFVHGHSPVHALPAQAKLAALGVFVLAVVATPRHALWAFAAYAVLVIVAASRAGLGPGFVAKRMLIELPFVLFAVALPFLGGGERVHVLGIALSREGLWGAWTILAKGSLGVAGSILVTATTTVPDILSGLERLRLPRLMVAIAGFMVRYLDVIAGETKRMRVAMLSRGYQPRWIWQTRAYATSAGALFIRSYERGERVYHAMVARGFDGSMPRFGEAAASGRDWMRAMSLPVLAGLLAVVAVLW